MTEVASKRQRIETKLYECKEAKVEFDIAFPTNDVQLFEIPEDVASEVQLGGYLCIKGNKDLSDAVLCTKEKTYSIKKVETSNTVYVVPASDGDSYVVSTGAVHQFYELKPTQPKLSAIMDLLADTMYSGQDETLPGSKSKLLTLQDLEEIVPASKREITETIRKEKLVEIDGYIRKILPVCAGEVCRNLLDSILEHAMPLSAVSFDQCKAVMEGVDDVILTFVLNSLGHTTDNILWALTPDEVAIASAHSLFQAAPAKIIWPIDDFLATWTARTPGSSHPSPALLRGIAITEENIDVASGGPSLSKSRGTTTSSISQPSYRYLPANKLNKDLPARIGELYAVRNRFTIDELEAYFVSYFGDRNQPKTLVELLLPFLNKVDDYFYKK